MRGYIDQRFACHEKKENELKRKNSSARLHLINSKAINANSIQLSLWEWFQMIIGKNLSENERRQLKFVDL